MASKLSNRDGSVNMNYQLKTMFSNESSQIIHNTNSNLIDLTSYNTGKSHRESNLFATKTNQTL